MSDRAFGLHVHTGHMFSTSVIASTIRFKMSVGIGNFLKMLMKRGLKPNYDVEKKIEKHKVSTKSRRKSKYNQRENQRKSIGEKKKQKIYNKSKKNIRLGGSDKGNH